MKGHRLVLLVAAVGAFHFAACSSGSKSNEATGGISSGGTAGLGGDAGNGATGGAGATAGGAAGTDGAVGGAAGDAGQAGGGGGQGGSDGGSACGGPVLQGSFVIQNPVDVQTVSSYAQIAGDLLIEGDGLTQVSLPLLCSVGGALWWDEATDLKSVDLPSLVSAKELGGDNVVLTTLAIDKLTKVSGALSIGVDGALSLPMLENASHVTISGALTQVNLPKLAGGVGVFIVASSTTFALAANGISSAQQLSVLGAGGVSLSALTTVTGNLHLQTGCSAGTMLIPSLTSVGGNFDLTATTCSVSFPALTSIGGAVTIDSTGSFSAPSAVIAGAGLTIRNVSSVDLSALQTVGGVGIPSWSTRFELDSAKMSTLQLPALKSACLLLGNPAYSTTPPYGPLCNSGNTSLTQIVAPNLTQGGVQFFNNPLFPKCRADALAAQIVSPVPANYPGGFEHCPLASGPCP